MPSFGGRKQPKPSQRASTSKPKKVTGGGPSASHARYQLPPPKPNAVQKRKRGRG